MLESISAAKLILSVSASPNVRFPEITALPVTVRLPPTSKLAGKVTSLSASSNTALLAGSVQNTVLLPAAKSILVVLPADVSITVVRARVSGDASATVPIPISHVPSDSCTII